MFFTYVDFTHDGRPFYVGMGDELRLRRKLGRNKHHTNVVKKHGQNRVIVLETDDRTKAIQLEIELIAKHHTFIDDPFYNAIGCNYTVGGEGCKCSEETKAKMRESIRRGFENGRQVWNKGKQGIVYNISDAQRQQAREQLIAFNKTKPMLGKNHTEEAKAKMRKQHICSNCKSAGHNKSTCRKRPADFINQVSIAQLARREKE